MTITIEDLRSTYDSLAACCLHDPQWSPDDVTEVVAMVWEGDDTGGMWKPGEKTCSESESYTVVRLKDGRYGLLAEGEDYTGHGCQCSSSTAVYGSLDELLTMGVPEDGAREAITAVSSGTGTIEEQA